jgi:hypothetical protein
MFVRAMKVSNYKQILSVVYYAFSEALLRKGVCVQLLITQNGSNNIHTRAVALHKTGITLTIPRVTSVEVGEILVVSNWRKR